MSDQRALRVKAEWHMSMLETLQQTGGNTLFIATYDDLREAMYSVLAEIRAEEAKEKLYTTAEFAERKGVTKMTLHRWVKAGILKPTRYGGKVYYKDSDLQQG